MYGTDNYSGYALSILNSTLCSDSSSIFYLLDDLTNPILEIGPNDQIKWSIDCDGDTLINEIWNATDVVNNIIINPITGDSISAFGIPIFTKLMRLLWIT